MFAPMKPGMFASAMGFNPVKIGASADKPVEKPKPAATPPPVEARASAMVFKSAADLSMDEELTPVASAADASFEFDEDSAPRAQAAPSKHEVTTSPAS